MPIGWGQADVYQGQVQQPQYMPQQMPGQLVQQSAPMQPA